MPTKGYTQNLSHKKRISKALKGKRLGCKHSEETKDKIRKAMLGKQYALGKHWILSGKTKYRMSRAKKGIVVSEETKKKLRISSKAWNNKNPEFGFQKGHLLNVGRKHSTLTKNKMSRSRKKIHVARRKLIRLTNKKNGTRNNSK